MPLDSPDAPEGIMRALFDGAPDAIVVVDEAGRIALVNRQAERLFGYARDELIGEAVEVLMPDRFRHAHAGHRQRFARAPRVRAMGSGMELVGRRRDGTELLLEISLSPFGTAGGVLTSACIRDLTDRKEDEYRIRRVQGHLLSAVESIQGAF